MPPRDAGKKPRANIFLDEGGGGRPNVFMDDEPNLLERGAAAVADTPVLGGILEYLGRFGNVGLNVASAGQSALAGEGERARERLDAAGRTIPHLLPGTDPIEQEDYLDPGTVLDELGLEGEMGRVDIPVLGAFTGRGVAKFGLAVATDPLIYTRVGGLTPRGVRALKGTGPSGASFYKHALKEAGKTGKLPSTIGVAAEAGHRNLLTFMGQPIVPRALSTPALKAIGRANTALRSTVFSPFVSKTGTVLDTVPESALIKVGGEMKEHMARFEPTMQKLEEIAVRRYDANRKGFANLDDARQTVFNELALATEKGGDAVGTLARTRGGPEVSGLSPIRKAELRSQYSALRAKGHSRREAGIMVRQVATGTPEDFAILGSVMRRQMDALLKVELDAGSYIQALTDPGMFYLMHWITPQARGLMGWAERAKLQKKFNEMYAGHPSMLRRGKGAKTTRMQLLLRGSAIPELNKTLQPWALKEFPRLRKAHEDWLARGRRGADPGNIFETDPRRLVAERGRRAQKAATAGYGMDEGLRHFASTLDNEAITTGTHVAVEDVLRPLKLQTRFADDAAGGGLKGGATRLAKYEGMMVHKEIANALQKTFVKYTNPAAPGTILRLFDTAMGYWKTGVTVLFPEFHMRNMASNIWANYLGDVSNPAVYARAYSVMRDFSKGGNKVWDLGGKKITTREIMHSMEAGRALGFGTTFVDADLAAGRMAGQAHRITGSKFGKVGAAVRELGPTALARGYTGIPFLLGPRTGKAIGQAFESHAKVAHVIDKLSKGWTMESAILSAKKYLFDYGDLTPFEQMYMRRLVPFYTWLRKNTPLQIETLVTKPGKIAVLRHMQQAVEDEPVGTIDTSVLPDWIRRRWHAVNRKDDGAVGFVAGIGLGTEDLAIFDPDRTLPDLLSMLNPLLKAGAELALNRDFFRDVPLDRSEYAPSILRHMPKAFLDHIDFRPVKERSGEVRFYRANPRWLALFRGIPATGALSRVATTAEKFAENARSSYDATGKFFTGIKRGEIGVEKQALNLLYYEREALNERLEELQRKGATRDLKVFVRRTDIAPDTPEAKEVRSILQRKRLIAKLTKRLYAKRRAGPSAAEQQEAIGLQRGTRSMGAGQ